MQSQRDLKLVIATLCGLFVAMAAFALPLPQAKLNATSGATGDLFGRSVSISGDIAIVGADQVDDVGSNFGAAYIFQRGGSGGWGPVAQLTASDGVAEDHFGLSVSISGDTAIVGASYWNKPNDFGAAYIFQRDHLGPDQWGEVIKLTADDAEAGDFFGRSVSISGDIAVVGAPYEDGAGHDAGAVYIFIRDHGGPDKWEQAAKLYANDADVRDLFGSTVSISCNTVIVGAHQNDDLGTESGAAYVFRRDHGGLDSWAQVVKLTANNGASGERFGIAVALSGDTAVVGAFQDNDAGFLSGSAYIFERDHGGPNHWGQVTKLTAGAAAAGAHFGNSVSISGDTVVIGSYWADNESGVAYIFERDAGGANTWGQVASFTAFDGAPGHYFGVSVAIDGDTTVIGAYQDDDLGVKSGSAYVFDATGGCP